MHVSAEAHIRWESNVSRVDVIHHTKEFLEASCPVLMKGDILSSNFPEYLSQHVDKMIVYMPNNSITRVSYWQAEVSVNAFKLHDQEPERGTLSSEDDMSSFELWELPNKNLLGLWDSIIVENSIKQRLLGYCDASLRFSDANIGERTVLLITLQA